MKKLKFYARWEDGVFNWKSPGWVKEQLAGLEDCDLIITMEKDYGKRTSQQNRYWWGSLVPAVLEGLRDVGYNEIKTPEQAHEFLKHKFLMQKIVNEKTGEIIEVPRSTTELSKKEESELFEEIWQWAAEFLGINIESPGAQSKLFAV